MGQLNESPRGAVLSLREAAAATNVSYSTIKRRQPEFTHAYRDSSGTWRMPISDLLGAGLKLRIGSAEPVSQPSELPMNGAELVKARAEIQELGAKLAAERERRLVAETEARLLAANLDDFRRLALAGPPKAQEPAPVPVAAPAATEPVQAAGAAAVVAESPSEPVRARQSPSEPVRARRGLWARIRGD